MVYLHRGKITPDTRVYSFICALQFHMLRLLAQHTTDSDKMQAHACVKRRRGGYNTHLIYSSAQFTPDQRAET
jgi:hypothetical protein